MKRVLIANRGEIALRIIRTCKRLGIETVGVYSAEERESLHRAAADQAVQLQGAGALAGYLDGDQMVRIAKESGCDAVHPGYGFLSESSLFAEQVRGAGMLFVGPHSETLRVLGDKNSARALAKKIGIPVPGGYEGEEQTDERLIREADAIGFPLLIKAVAGGGGRGMRLVRHREQLQPAIEGARREAVQGFGDGRLILEQYIEGARHIEVQLLGDEKGCVRHCFERECSVQRRFQKIVEESPAPLLSETLRERLFDAAVQLGSAANLVNAATVEFLVTEHEFFLLEANCRLQVEHPVTEMVTGLDLVEQQLRIAEGGEISELGIRCCGAAIEVRVYAEVPERGFVPSEGRIEAASFAGNIVGQNGGALTGSEMIRIESGVFLGMEVTTSFDPMLAKIICGGANREESIERLREALSSTQIEGIDTNLGFLRRLSHSEAFCRGKFFTTSLSHRGERAEEAVASLVAAGGAVRERTLDYFRPLTLQGVTRLGAPARRARVFDLLTGEERCVGVLVEQVERSSEGVVTMVSVGEASFSASTASSQTLRPLEVLLPGGEAFYINGREILGRVDRERGEVVLDGLAFRVDFDWREPAGREQGRVGERGEVRSPLPGKILRYYVEVGGRVERGQVVAQIESMKMEHNVVALEDGEVRLLGAAPGSAVRQGEVLAVIA